MAQTELLDTIRAEIERLEEMDYPCNTFEQSVGFYDALARIKSFLDTLQEPELPGIDEQGIPGKDYIPVEWVDACEKYGRWKIVQKVKSASEDLEEEIAGMYQALFGTDIINRKEMLYLETFNAIARHFYELGCRRTAEMYDEIEYNRQRAEETELSEDLEEEIRRWIHAQRNNGRRLFGWIDMVELAARHFAEWGAKNAK